MSHNQKQRRPSGVCSILVKTKASLDDKGNVIQGLTSVDKVTKIKKGKLSQEIDLESIQVTMMCFTKFSKNL